MPVVRDLMSIVEVAVNSFWRSKQMLLGNVSTSYMVLPVRPAPFLQKTVQRFEDELKECCDWIDKHKWLSYLNACRPHPSSSSLQVIEETLSNNYALILHLAGKVIHLAHHGTLLYPSHIKYKSTTCKTHKVQRKALVAMLYVEFHFNLVSAKATAITCKI